MNFKIHRILKDIKVNKLRQKIYIRLNLKTRFVWKEEKHTVIRQMSWSTLDTYVKFQG